MHRPRLLVLLVSAWVCLALPVYSESDTV